MLEQKTWRDIEVLSLHDPFLHAAVTMVRQGLPREDVLIATVIALANCLQIFTDAKTEALIYGTSFVAITHTGGDFSIRRIDPASVVVTPTSP